MKGIDTLIFDMYGVIAVEPDGLLMSFISGHFPNLTEADVYKHWIRAAVGGMTSLAFLEAIGFGKDAEEIERVYLDGLLIDENFVPLARRLRGRYRIALLSNDIAEWNAYLRGKHELDELFDAVVVSGDVGLRKPDPEIYALTLDRLGVQPSQCLFVDDRLRNLKAALDMGIEGVHFTKTPGEYGGRWVGGFDELETLLWKSHSASITVSK